MSQKYFAILTTYGEAQIAEATAQNKTIHIEKMAVGDGGGNDTTPDENQTQLIKENYRSNLNSLKSEAGKNTVIAELIIKENVGGWWIREMGLYDDKGGLIAVANCPASYKPQLEEGSGKVQTLRMVFVVSNTAAVTISASQDIGIASIELVEETMKQHIADDDPHSKDYYNKKITDKTNADLRQDLSDTAVKEGNRGRDEAIQHADEADSAHSQAADPHPQYTTEGETKGLIEAHVNEANPHGERYYLKSEADDRYPILGAYLGKSLSINGVYNSNAELFSDGGLYNWTQGAFHNYTQFPLDNKATWLVSQRTQYSQGYSILSKIGTYRNGYAYGASMVFQMTGEADLALGRWEMRQDGTLLTKHMTLNQTTEAADFSRVVFEKKNPSATKQILGAITWDSFRDVSAVSNVAAIWAEGAGEAANWGELHFGVTTNGDGNLPTKIMSISDGRVLTSQLHTYYLKSRDPAGSIADRARDYDGVSSLLRWQNYGNGHVIFDGSNGLSPKGGGVSTINATEPWKQSYPVLMGWNGENTFGVRVDACRTADKLVDGSFGVPTGVPVPWPSNTPPAGWIFLQGQGINPAEAPVLASLYGATLPDLRGMYISGWDAGRGIDPGREVLSYQAANVGEHQHTVPFDDGGWLSYSGGGGQPGVNYVRTQPRATVDGPQGRTHPDNIAFNYIVRWG
ncbi:phage tail-collar fiber domain-containing protein [Iodobacter fluviatilis]|uniref:Tail collar domain n=1 Tax=Iodobacter fluviatilis TaxID=537 RepID=A0A377Q3F5_9NEIS|nr:phage tail protein [Iodobacter fluviatilis]TCU90261.1 tail collar domain [Iodobacter fluviatilis]STQ89288.1 Phage Tail Collar Domain [Iodobacter fluviatilis]